MKQLMNLEIRAAARNAGMYVCMYVWVLKKKEKSIKRCSSMERSNKYSIHVSIYALRH